MTSTPAPETLRARLRDGASGARGPLLLGPSLTDVAHGVPTHDGADTPGQAVAVALRKRADAIVALQREVAETGADLLVAPTSCTTAPALHATGQAYRAAALTAAAVDLTRDAALAARPEGERRAAVIGEVPASSGARARAEAELHVERLATSAIDAVLVLAADVDAARDVVRAALAHELPTLVEVDAKDVDALAGSLSADESALPDVVLVRAATEDAAVAAVDRVRHACPTVAVGVRLLAPEQDPQTALLAAWSGLASLGLAVLGVGGSRAIEALAALSDLSRAPRPSLS